MKSMHWNIRMRAACGAIDGSLAPSRDDVTCEKCLRLMSQEKPERTSH